MPVGVDLLAAAGEGARGQHVVAEADDKDAERWQQQLPQVIRVDAGDSRCGQAPRDRPGHLDSDFRTSTPALGSGEFEADLTSAPPGDGGIAGVGTGIRPFDYLTSMVVTIGLWLTLVPAIGAATRSASGSPKH